jgi:hypothetical protein
MDPNTFGKRVGIGLRIAGRMAQQRVQESTAEAGSPASGNGESRTQAPQQSQGGVSREVRTTSAQIRDFSNKSHKVTRAAGRGIGGFLRPFGRVGGLLWLEVTGFFFGLFAVFFAQGIWRTRLSYASGPEHTRFLIAVGLTAVFAYLSVSAFWRARRR